MDRPKRRLLLCRRSRSRTSSTRAGWRCTTVLDGLEGGRAVRSHDWRPLVSLGRRMRMAIAGSCHCGAVSVTVPGVPEWVASCNCSICRRTAWLVAYYPDDGQVRVEGETRRYVWGDRM